MQDCLQPEKDFFLDLIDALFVYCIKHRVTDLHLETNGHLRLRQNETLGRYPHFNPRQVQQLKLRFKILASLDIHQLQLPQDGHCEWTGPNGTQKIPCRISTCPAQHGEKMVVRLLNQKQIYGSWQNLGLSLQQQTLIEAYAKQNSGLILINGPTGSGKTTTLYSLLNHLNSQHLNMISIEDPIEIYCSDFHQIELNTNLGFGIDECLRTVLRQDPDLIMLGEIRDQKTARLALNAVLCGHLVLTSLHAPSNLGVLDRLKQLGIHPHAILPYLSILIAQRMSYHAKTHETKVEFDVLELTPELKQQLMRNYDDLQ